MILTLVRARRISEGDELEALCRSLRIISARDMDGTVTVVFRSMLVEGAGRPVGSSELAELTRLNRVTIIHHLQRLEQMGLVEHAQRKYRLRVSGLGEAVERMREEMMRSFQEAEEMAQALDREFEHMRNVQMRRVEERADRHPGVQEPDEGRRQMGTQARANKLARLPKTDEMPIAEPAREPRPLRRPRKHLP